MMAANNRGGMRPQGRSPPFLAVGLFVALCILGFNYWSMSSRNAELGNEITLLESEVRVLSAKKVSAEKRSESVLDKVKDLEEMLKKEKNNLANKEAEMAECKKTLQIKEDDVKEAREEADNCRSLSSSCEEDKKNLQTDVDKLKVEVTNFQAAAAQQTANACSESGCKQYVDQYRDKILEMLVKIQGLGVVQILHANGIDVGTYLNNPVQSNQPQGPNVPNPKGQQDNINPVGALAMVPSNPELKQQTGLGNQPVAAGQPVANPVGTNGNQPVGDGKPVANPIGTNQSNHTMNQPNVNPASNSQLSIGNQPGSQILPGDKSLNKNPTYKFEQAPDVRKEPHSARLENNKVENVKPPGGGQNQAAAQGSLDKTDGDKDHKKDFDGEAENYGDDEAKMKLKFEPASDANTPVDGIDEMNRNMQIGGPEDQDN